MGRGQTESVGYGQTLRLLDRIGPLGRFDENSQNFVLFNFVFLEITEGTAQNAVLIPAPSV